MKNYIKILPALFVAMGFSADNCKASEAYETFVNNMAGKKNNNKESKYQEERNLYLNNVKQTLEQNIEEIYNQVGGHISNIRSIVKNLSKIKDFNAYNKVLTLKLNNFWMMLRNLQDCGYNKNKIKCSNDMIEKYIKILNDIILDCFDYMGECEALYDKVSRNSKIQANLYKVNQIIRDFVSYLRELPGSKYHKRVSTAFG